MPPLFLAVLALGGLFLFGRASGGKRNRRVANSDREDMPETLDVDLDATIWGVVGEALGWPYFWGRGSPSTSWADGPDGVDCNGFVQMALVKLGILGKAQPDRGAMAFANEALVAVAVGKQRAGDVAVYKGHTMLVVGPPGTKGHSAVMGASGGHGPNIAKGILPTLGNDPKARVKVFETALYRGDFVTYGRVREGLR